MIVQMRHFLGLVGRVPPVSRQAGVAQRLELPHGWRPLPAPYLTPTPKSQTKSQMRTLVTQMRTQLRRPAISHASAKSDESGKPQPQYLIQPLCILCRSRPYPLRLSFLHPSCRCQSLSKLPPYLLSRRRRFFIRHSLSRLRRLLLNRKCPSRPRFPSRLSRFLMISHGMASSAALTIGMAWECSVVH